MNHPAMSVGPARSVSTTGSLTSNAFDQNFLRVIQDTPSVRRNRLLKLLFVFAVPVLALAALSSMNIILALKVKAQSSMNTSSIATTVQISRLVTNLQRERGMTSVFISSKSPDAWQKLIPLRNATLDAIQKIREWPGKETDEAVVTSRETFKSVLLEHRVDKENSFNRTSIQEVLWYHNFIYSIMGLINRDIKLTGDTSGQMWTYLFSLELFVKAKECFGMQRATGSGIFGKGYSTTKEKLIFRENYLGAKTYLDLCFDHSVRSQRIYRNIEKDNVALFKLVEDMRDIILKDRKMEASAQRGLVWFGNMTAFIDSMAPIENDLVGAMASQLDSQSQNAEEDLTTAVVFLIVVALVCPPLCVWFFYALNQLNRTIIQATMNLTKEIAELSAEKKRGERLLQRLLPPAVIEALRTGIPIYLSDIVGFTKISARSTPLQVVNLLNQLYTAFDKELDLHDVYKVETIGDAYMVVSGVPVRNGDAHGSEIAAMALTLLALASSFQIPHLEDEKLAIRIGLHTGPVLAGVVGRKMPRYCLFGKAVLFTEHMEQTSLPLRIQVSKDCAQLLTKIGGFELELRNGKETYWLLKRTAVEKRVQEPWKIHNF